LNVVDIIVPSILWSEKDIRNQINKLVRQLATDQLVLRRGLIDYLRRDILPGNECSSSASLTSSKNLPRCEAVRRGSGKVTG
jgi:hypothetical protein